jgi:hypothetical protein
LRRKLFDQSVPAPADHGSGAGFDAVPRPKEADLCRSFARSLRCIPAITAVNKGLDAYVAVDACGTFSETKRQMGLLRMMQAGVILSDYAALMIEVLKDNGRPQAGAVYGAIDMDWAKLVGQIAQAEAK